MVAEKELGGNFEDLLCVVGPAFEIYERLTPSFISDGRKKSASWPHDFISIELESIGNGPLLV